MTYGTETLALATQAENKLAAVQTKMERSILNFTYRDRKTNIWIREKIKVKDVMNMLEDRSGPGQGTLAGYKVTDEHCVSPPGNPTKGKYLEEGRQDGGETN